RIAELARERKATFSGVLAQARPADVGAAAARAIAGFLSLLDNSRASLAQAEAEAAARPPQAGDQTPLAAWAEQLFERVGLEDALRSDLWSKREAQVLVDNLLDMIVAITRYDRWIWAEKRGDVLEQDRLTYDEHWAPPCIHDALGCLALAVRDEKDDDS